MPELINSGLFDVVTDVTMVNLGVFAGDGVANMSKLFWDDLAAEDRDAFVKAVQYGSVESVATWVENEETARTKGEEAGIRFLEPDAEVMAKREAFIEDYLSNADTLLEEKGIENAAPKIDRYKALVAKWEKLIAENGTDRDTLAELRYREIWSQVDMTAYGN